LQSLFNHTVFAFGQTVEARYTPFYYANNFRKIIVPYVTKIRVKQRNVKFSLIIPVK